MFVAQSTAAKQDLFFEAQVRTSMKCTDSKTSETHNSQWHGIFVDQGGEITDSDQWKTASVLVNHPKTPEIGK